MLRTAIRVPVGDRDGVLSDDALLVMSVWSEPLAFIVYSCVVPAPGRELVKRMSPLDGRVAAVTERQSSPSEGFSGDAHAG
jgi:hypothetical protein